MPFDWREQWARKVTTVAAALERIRPGDRVFIGSACGEPQELVRGLVTHGRGLADTELIQVLTFGVAPYSDPRYADTFRANAFFIGNSVREAVNETRADYTPVFLSQVPGLFRSRRLPIDVALVMVSPPDEHGFCSLGVSVDITKAAAECARTVIAQVNVHMPRTLGDCFLHVDQIACLVPHDEPLLEWPTVEVPDDVTRQIAAHIARLVPDGATLQLGIGRLPDAILAHLTDKIDLGVHTEMFSDGVMKLAQAGVINGRRKTLHRGKIVGSFAAGSRELFRFLDNNPMIEMHPSDYTNDLSIISRHDNMVAINGAVEIDLTGQVVADSIGAWFYSGIGGHADFIRGAALARGGRPIIALPSTARTKDGVRSRISAFLQEGAGVVTTRGDTHYVVTEYGAAYLHGKTLRERAMSLIRIAHPDFRSELLHAAKKRRIVFFNQILPPARQPYPSEYEQTVRLKDGSQVFVRPVNPDDEPAMKDFFYALSQQSVYLRFHGPVKAMPHERLQVFCTVDYETEMALVALIGPPGSQEIVASARYVADAGMQSAELAFVVRDDWQNRGLGTYLFRRLLEIARSKGLRRFTAEVLQENTRMLTIFHRSGLDIQTRTDEGVVHLTMTLPADQPLERGRDSHPAHTGPPPASPPP